MKQLIFHLLLFGILFQAQAQDVMVAVKKGSALVNSAKLQSNSLPKKITKSTVINAESGTVLLVKKGDKYNKSSQSGCPKLLSPRKKRPL